MFPQTRPAAPVDSKSAKVAPGIAEMLGAGCCWCAKRRACVPARQMEPELSRARVPFALLPLLLLLRTTGTSPKRAGALSQERKIRKQTPDGFRQSSMRKSCLHDEAGI